MFYLFVEHGDALDERITRTLMNFGISPVTRSFRYLHQSVRLACDEPRNTLLVTKSLYPRVAKLFRTEMQRVQSGCRACIRQAYMRHGMDAFEEYFDHKCRPLKASAFIQLTAEKLRRGEL